MGTTARYIRERELIAYDQWDKLPIALQGLDTRVVLIGPEGWLFNLAGRDAGKQGVRLSQQLKGDYHLPFEIITTEGAYEMGVTIERVNYLKREISAGFTVGAHTPIHMTNFQYRWAEDRFWSQLREDADSWLGIYTRFTGWRWTKIRLANPVDTPQKMDVAAYGNNVASWDATILATKPYFSKPALFDQWDAAKALIDNDGVDVAGEGIITLANRADMPAYVKYLIDKPGECSVQDNVGGPLVPLPTIHTEDGFVLVDTDPQERTLTTSNDPVDNLFYQTIRASVILEAFLHNLADTGIPLWQKFDRRFMYSIPPRTVAHLRVKHSNPLAKITAIVPQHYKRSR